MLQDLLNSDRWKKKRTEYMIAARACRDALTNPEGYWKLEPTDPRVKEAMSFWVHRARNSHAFALGRKPVIPNVIVISDARVYSGAAYVTDSTPQEIHA